MQRGSTMALIQERSSPLLHCPEENRKECAITVRTCSRTRCDWPCPAHIHLLPTYSTDRHCQGQGNNSSSCLAQPASSSYSTGMLHDRGKAHPLQEPGQKVSFPCLITVGELFHIITTIQPFLFLFLFLSFLFFLAFAL